MRVIETPNTDQCNKGLVVCAMDEPGAGGANHRYEVRTREGTTCINFQNGPVKESGPNGLTNEVLLAIVADRLQSFQAGPCACKENDEAANAVQAALNVLESRSQRRIDAGVEGTSEPAEGDYNATRAPTSMWFPSLRTPRRRLPSRRRRPRRRPPLPIRARRSRLPSASPVPVDG